MLKVSVIGGGSTYTPELVKGFLERTAHLPLTEFCLMDIDETRLEIVGNFVQRIVEARGMPFRVTLTTDRRYAVDGASYVITQLRVGQMLARRDDEYLGKRHGLIGQETTGIGGLAKALRTIPVILGLAEEIQRTAPDALLVNFANPAGLVTQALSMFAPQIQAVGVCNVAITTKMDMVEQLSQEMGEPISPERAELDTLGLNHLTWHRGLKVDGVEKWDLVLAKYIESSRNEEHPEYPVKLIETLRMIPNYYLQYYYSTHKKLEEQKGWPPSRAEEVMEVEKDLLRQYKDPNLTDPPSDLMKRGGAYYSTVATQLINAHYNDLNETHIVNTRNNGSVEGWPDDWVLEMPCKIGRKGIHAVKAEPLPEVCFGLIAQVKTFELLAARAAVSGDRNLLYKALLAHPLGPEVDCVTEVMEDLLVTHKKHLPLFWKS